MFMQAMLWAGQNYQLGQRGGKGFNSKGNGISFRWGWEGALGPFASAGKCTWDTRVSIF